MSQRKSTASTLGIDWLMLPAVPCSSPFPKAPEKDSFNCVLTQLAPHAILLSFHKGTTSRRLRQLSIEYKLMNYTRSQEVSRLQAEQKVQNCALLLAYVSGSPGGWYGIVKSSIDGFSSDYALISSNVGDWECHPAQVFCVTGDEDAREELEEIRQAVKKSFGMDELPMVATLTEEEIQAAKQNVKEAWTEHSANLGTIDGIPVKIDNDESVSRGDNLDREGGKEGARCYALDEVLPLTEEDLAEWLEELCSKSGSDLSYCNWEAVAETVNE